MIATAIQKGNGIEGLIRGHPIVLDHAADINHNGPDFTALNEKFDKYIESCARYLRGAPLPELTEVLSPLEINAFLQDTIRHDEHPYYEYTGPFLSRLIQASFDAGYNNFELDTRNIKEINGLCTYLIGPYPVNVKVNGNVGDAFGTYSENATFVIEGNAGIGLGMETNNCTFTAKDVSSACGRESVDSTFFVKDTQNGCGHGSKNSSFTIRNTQGDCGIHSKNSIFNIEGDYGPFLGRKSIGSTFTVNGGLRFTCTTYGEYCGDQAKGSTFRTPNKKTYNRMAERVRIVEVNNYPEPIGITIEETGNKVELILPTLTERIWSRIEKVFK